MTASGRSSRPPDVTRGRAGRARFRPKPEAPTAAASGTVGGRATRDRKVRPETCSAAVWQSGWAGSRRRVPGSGRCGAARAGSCTAGARRAAATGGGPRCPQAPAAEHLTGWLTQAGAPERRRGSCHRVTSSRAELGYYSCSQPAVLPSPSWVTQGISFKVVL